MTQQHPQTDPALPMNGYADLPGVRDGARVSSWRMLAAKLPPSYHQALMRGAAIAYDFLDVITFGHVEWVRRVSTYLMVGGIAAIVNLLTFSAIYRQNMIGLLARVGPNLRPGLHWLITFTVATEISIIPNFLGNDSLTFRRLAGRQRPWLSRFGRFHVTCALGTLLTFMLSAAQFRLGMQPTVAQAIAILIATAFNYGFHHAYTYRRLAP
jgi:putative flippase GtrA